MIVAHLCAHYNILAAPPAIKKKMIIKRIILVSDNLSYCMVQLLPQPIVRVILPRNLIALAFVIWKRNAHRHEYVPIARNSVLIRLSRIRKKNYAFI